MEERSRTPERLRATRGDELTVVVPVWTRDHRLADLLASLPAALRGLGARWEIVVVCPPQHSGLRPIVEAADATFVPAPGPGYGEILRAGLRRAPGDFVVTMDADLSTPGALLRRMWDRRGDADVVLGSRWAPGAQVGMRPTRILLSRWLNGFYRTVLSLPYRDLSSGFRLFHRRVLEDTGPPGGRGLEALPEMVVKALAQGWRIVEVPIAYRPVIPWTRRRLVSVGTAFAPTLWRLFALRNSVRSADYDHRAFDSWIPLQRYWQRHRFRIVHEFLAGATRVLDIGCGSSRIVQAIPNAVGTDLAIRKLRWLRARRPGLPVLQADMNRLPFRDRTFDALVCSEVIEHVPREAVRLSEFERVVRPGGTIVVGTPDYGRVRWRALEWIYGKVFPGGYVSEHINRYTHRDLRSQLEGLGLEILDCRYVGGSEMIFRARVPAPRGPSAPASPGRDARTA